MSKEQNQTDKPWEAADWWNLPEPAAPTSTACDSFKPKSTPKC